MSSGMAMANSTVAVPFLGLQILLDMILSRRKTGLSDGQQSVEGTIRRSFVYSSI